VTNRVSKLLKPGHHVLWAPYAVPYLHQLSSNLAAVGLQTIYKLGFILIRQYHDIDRGIGDLAIIAAPRDCTISCINARLTSALLNSSCQIHMVIIIARTVMDATWKALTDGQTATERHHVTAPSNTHSNITQCHIFLSVLSSHTSSLFKPTMTTTAVAAGELCGWPAPMSLPCPHQCHVPSTEVCGLWKFHQRSTSSDHSNMQSWVCSEALYS